MNLPNLRRSSAYRITYPLVGILSRSGITPTALSLINLALSIVAACVIAMGHFVPGGVLVLVAGLFDLLDGAVARFTKRSTKFGAILDSTVDRVSEAAILAGLLVWYARQQASLEEVGLEIVLLLIFAVLVGSFLVSYLRARAEGLGLQCQIGLFTRAERVIVLAIGLLVDQVFIALCILVAFVSITVVQRLVYLRKQAATGGD